MGKENATVKKSYTFDEAQAIINDVALSGGVVPDGVDMASVWAVLESTEGSGFEALQHEYWKPKNNQLYGMIYEGLLQMNFKDGPATGAYLKDQQGNKFVFAGATLVKTVQDLVPPVFIRVHVGELKKGQKGSFLETKIETFPGAKKYAPGTNPFFKADNVEAEVTDLPFK